VDVALFETPAQARAAMRLGTRRLILLQVPSGVRAVAADLPVATKLALSRHPYPSAGALLDDCAACAADQVIDEAGGPARDAAGFARLLEAARRSLAPDAAAVVLEAARVLAEAHEVEVALGQATSPALAPVVTDLRAQLDGLIYRGFVADAGAARLTDVVRYLRAMLRRLEKGPGELGRDAERMAVVHRISEDYRAELARLPEAERDSPAAREIRWMIEELRVSLFAQTLGTRGPVSERRILAALDRL
jgi:ATP-dependent helicase HrpA